MSIPCCDQLFEVAYISSHIFSYPMIITSRILQECMRISRRVIVIPALGSQRKAWAWEFLLIEREINRNYYLSSDTMEFEFHKLEDGSYQVLSPQIMARQAASRSHCPVLLASQSRQVWHQKVKVMLSRLALVNLTDRDTDELRGMLERALGILFEQTYRFPAPVNSAIALTKDVPVALAGCGSSILFFVQSRHAMQEESVAQWLQCRDVPDFLLELDGTLFRLGENHPIS